MLEYSGAWGLPSGGTSSLRAEPVFYNLGIAEYNRSDLKAFDILDYTYPTNAASQIFVRFARDGERNVFYLGLHFVEGFMVLTKRRNRSFRPG